MPAADGRIKAAENEARILRALHRFGWLTARNAGALLWTPWARHPAPAPDLRPAKPSASGLRMAQRTFRRLVERGQVLRAPAPGGHVIYALAEAGARRLQEIGVPAGTGKDLIRSFSAAHFQHRHTANNVAIRGLLDGFRVSTEREIAQDRWLGGAEGIAGKKPDVLLRSGDKIFFAEIERSRKNARDYGKLLAWLDCVRTDVRAPTGPKLLGPNLCWAKIIFVGSTAFQTKLLKDLAARGWPQADLDALLLFDTKLLYVGEGTFFV